MNICQVDGCEKIAIARGWCGAHYQMWKRHGDPVAQKAKHFDPVESFNAKVVRSDNGCIDWVGATIKDGYGMMKVNGKSILAHRFSYEMSHGKIPEGMLVCHSCDNPRCVNPEHLFLGSHQDNMDDMISKRRDHKSCGEGHGRAKLSKEQVSEIRKSGETYRTLAAKFHVSKSQIGNIKTNAQRRLG